MKEHRSTFRLRLAIHTMLVAGALVATISLAAWWYLQRQLERNLDLRVSDAAQELWTHLTPRHGTNEMREAAAAIFGSEELSHGKVAVLMQSHATGVPVIYASDAAPSEGFPDQLPSGVHVDTSPNDPNPLASQPPARRGSVLRPQMPEIRDPAFFTVANTSGEWRYVSLSSPRYTVFVGLSTQDFYAEVRHAAWGVVAAASSVLLLAGLGAWLLAGRAMRPLRRVIGTAENLSAADLDARIPITPSDDQEFAQLIAVLNAMMERLDASFQQAARFTADASHELQTPLAVMQSTLHDALRADEPPPIEALLSEVSRLKLITQSLLLLSQADAGKLAIQPERYDLSAELGGIAEDAEALCTGAGLTCEHTLDPGIEIKADRALMRHVFSNLLGNAIKYNRTGGSVSLSLFQDRAKAIFSITNTGTDIPLEMQPRLFERFFRLEAARRSEGTGLGLNIAAELAKANGATVNLKESQSGRTTFVVTMPCSRSPGAS